MEADVYLYIYPMDSEIKSHNRLKNAAVLYLEEHGVRNAEERVLSWNIMQNRYGKPYFEEAPWLHFSISHSGVYWACAVADYPVGLDLQIRRKKYSFRIAERFFHPDEKAYLLGNGDFYAVWTAKESYVKYTGTGIGEGFDRFAVADETGMLNYVKIQGDCGPELRMTEIIENYCCCICAEAIGEVIFRKNA